MDETRRNFVRTAGIVTAAVVGSGGLNLNAQTSDNQGLGKLTTHTLPKLPYSYDALEPIIDRKPLEIHHSKHHQGYVTGLNKAEEELAKARMKNDFSLIQHWSKQSSFHGAGHFLHTLYWNSMTPGGGGKPDGKLAEKIGESFGTFEAFKAQFSAAAKAVEASGWAVLSYRPEDEKLLILQVENHQKLATWNVVPLLTIDVWEHAYYLKYQNKRADYVDGWWNLVNWKGAAKSMDIHK